MSARASTVVACDAGRCVGRSGCCEMCVQGVQLGNAECKCSAEGQAHVHVLEGAGELGAADTMVCGVVSGRACVVSVGSGARAMSGHTPPALALW